MRGRPPRPTLFPYTTLFRSSRTLPFQYLEIVAVVGGLPTHRIALVDGFSNLVRDRPSCRSIGILPVQAILLPRRTDDPLDRKSTRLNSSHSSTSYAVFCLKK